MTIITIGQRKGGNGKSTSALNLAHAFALTGKRVLLIDLDDQKNSTSAIGTIQQPAKTIEDTPQHLSRNRQAKTFTQKTGVHRLV